MLTSVPVVSCSQTWGRAIKAYWTPLHLEKVTAVNKRMGGPHIRHESPGEETNILAMPDIEPRFIGSPASSSVIHRLHYPVSPAINVVKLK